VNLNYDKQSHANISWMIIVRW